MIRRLNYTKRKSINHQDVAIALNVQDSGSITFDTDLHLSKYELPPGATVFVEAYRQTSWMRFNYGTIGAISSPTERTLTAFDSPEGILFRVRVTSTDSPKGILLAEADQIGFRSAKGETENRMPLLPVKPEDIGNQVYRIDFASVRPILLINAAVADWKAVARSREFFALVYPTVLREILVRIIKIEKYFETEDESDWRSKWLTYALSLHGSPDLPGEDTDVDAIDDWVDQAVEAFCKDNTIIDKFIALWTEVGE